MFDVAEYMYGHIKSRGRDQVDMSGTLIPDRAQADAMRRTLAHQFANDRERQLSRQ